jgi:hypothetical protein
LHFWKAFSGKEDYSSGNEEFKLLMENFSIISLDIGGRKNTISCGDASGNLFNF